MAGRTAIVTGASSGIGRAIALALATRGARLVLAARDRTRLDATAAETRQRGAPSTLVHAADLTVDGEPERLAQAVIEAGTGADVLVHALGVFTSGAIADTPLATLDLMWSTHVRSVYALTRALLPQLVAGGAGQIVFVNSSVIAGARGGIGPYAATKHAQKALADSLRDEVNPQGVRVLSVYPGRTATPMQEAILAAEGRPWQPERLLQSEDVAEIVVAALALPWTAEVTDLHVRPMQKIG